MKMSVARGLAAQCWRDPSVSDREMDADLAEVVATLLVNISNKDPATLDMIDQLEDDCFLED